MHFVESESFINKFEYGILSSVTAIEKYHLVGETKGCLTTSVIFSLLFFILLLS